MGLADAIPHLQDEGCVYMDYNATTPIFPEVRSEPRQTPVSQLDVSPALIITLCSL